jgi:hypothetical protein
MHSDTMSRNKHTVDCRLAIVLTRLLLLFGNMCIVDLMRFLVTVCEIYRHITCA